MKNRVPHRRPLSVCVFAGARTGSSRHASAAAEELGSLLGSRGHRLIYGGGGSGLMGTLAWSAHHAGAEVVAVMPTFLYEIERGIAAPPQTLRLTTTMTERKARMIEAADAFVALPGGFGTLDEVFEVLCLTYLEQHTKPLVLLDVEDAWRGLHTLVDEICRHGYADRDRCGLHMVARPAEAIATIEAEAVGHDVSEEAMC
ncbi:TIGR00730 family Rossman fold protein [Micromonospora echinofusca]|uniref:Cytokinin riboside 5'-monophosphate phosphoribohydrolase n=1 Tax=Micromonospora echinofusca TaxID=47858 RepID=A0ABS3VIZ3_MICEH|nr:TIGR00730 family Rossman fold protein [Micromonospora echinofusca]MBO4204423.1 TIGR00730 family Rossman fold protein [Micromonospora echinofusca]